MMDTKKKTWVVILLYYIGIIIVKDYLVNLFVHMSDVGNGVTYNSFKSALFQAFVLIIGAWICLRNVYGIGRRDAVYRRVPSKSFSEVCGFRKISVMTGLKGVFIGGLSYIAFNSIKNAYLMYCFASGEEIKWSTEVTAPEPGVFLFILFIFSLLMVVGEELVYRSMLFHNIEGSKENKIVVYLLSIVFFAIAHDSKEQMIQAAFLGLLLCLLMDFTKSVLVCIIIHMTYNIIGCVITYYSPMLLLNMAGFTKEMLEIEAMIVAVKLLLVAVPAVTVLFIMVQGIVNKTRISGETRKRG